MADLNVKWGGVLRPLKLKKTKNSKNKSFKLGNLSTKNCGLNPKFENCIFKDNHNVHHVHVRHVHVHHIRVHNVTIWCLT